MGDNTYRPDLAKYHPLFNTVKEWLSQHIASDSSDAEGAIDRAVEAVLSAVLDYIGEPHDEHSKHIFEVLIWIQGAINQTQLQEIFSAAMASRDDEYALDNPEQATVTRLKELGFKILLLPPELAAKEEFGLNVVCFTESLDAVRAAAREHDRQGASDVDMQAAVDSLYKAAFETAVKHQREALLAVDVVLNERGWRPSQTMKVHAFTRAAHPLSGTGISNSEDSVP